MAPCSTKPCETSNPSSSLAGGVITVAAFVPLTVAGRREIFTPFPESTCRSSCRGDRILRSPSTGSVMPPAPIRPICAESPTTLIPWMLIVPRLAQSPKFDRPRHKTPRRAGCPVTRSVSEGGRFTRRQPRSRSCEASALTHASGFGGTILEDFGTRWAIIGELPIILAPLIRALFRLKRFSPS